MHALADTPATDLDCPGLQRLFSSSSICLVSAATTSVVLETIEVHEFFRLSGILKFINVKKRKVVLAAINHVSQLKKNPAIMYLIKHKNILCFNAAWNTLK